MLKEFDATFQDLSGGVEKKTRNLRIQNLKVEVRTHGVTNTTEN
jgi:hypothetical protein